MPPIPTIPTSTRVGNGSGTGAGNGSGSGGSSANGGGTPPLALYCQYH